MDRKITSYHGSIRPDPLGDYSMESQATLDGIPYLFEPSAIALRKQARPGWRRGCLYSGISGLKEFSDIAISAWDDPVHVLERHKIPHSNFRNVQCLPSIQIPKHAGTTK